MPSNPLEATSYWFDKEGNECQAPLFPNGVSDEDDSNDYSDCDEDDSDPDSSRGWDVGDDKYA